MECSAVRTAKKTAAASTTSDPISSSVDPTPPSPEKKIESRITAPKSAIVPAAMISCPKVDEISPASLSTGISTPSEVAQRMIATSNGVSTRPPAFSKQPDGDRESEREREAEQAQPQHLSAQAREVDLEARQEQQERQPDHGDHLDRLVDVDEPEQRRTDDDAGHDLEHHRGQPDLREEAEHQGSGEGHRDDDQESTE